MSAYATPDDLDAIRAGLRGNTEAVCLALLGEPNLKGRRQWRYGRRGSLVVEVAGQKAGLWHSKEDESGGDVLALIRRERGGDFPAAVAWARSFLSMPETERPRATPRPASAIGADDDVAARIQRAQAFARNSEDVTGTVAEEYLVTTRGIPRPATGWSSAIRFHRGRNALLLVATDDARTVRAVQLVHLTSDAQKQPDEPGKPVKQSYGSFDGAAVRLPKVSQTAHSEPDALLLAEGAETGLSAWASTGRVTWIALGSVAKIQPPALTPLVVCADDDPRTAPAAKAVSKAVSRWRREGREVAVATPWSRRRFDKSDFNDVIRRDGPAAVVARIELALAPRAPQPPGNTALPVDLARLRLQDAVREFFAVARHFDPDAQDTEVAPVVHGIRVGVGLGKSSTARREAAILLTELRARGDKRTVVFAVPTLKLGDEQAREFEKLSEAQSAGLRAAVWRGREAADPDSPGNTMCTNLADVREAQSVGIKADTAVCRNTAAPGSPQCPFYSSCAYQAQKNQEADLWITAHELVYHEKPAAVGKPAVLIVDEAAWADGLEGIKGLPSDLTLDALDENVTVPNDARGLDTERLQYVHRIVANALAAHPDGPLRRDVLLAAGLTEDTGTSGRVQSWRRIVNPGLLPGMDPADRRAAIRAAQGNRTAMRLAKFFGALEALLADDGPEASGWASLVTEDTGDGPIRRLRLRGRRKVGKEWQTPTLHMDACLNPDLLRPYWSQITVTAEIEACTPHMRVRQLHGRDWPKSALVPDLEREGPAENERRLKNSERLRSAMWREARGTPGQVLVVAQLAVEDYWRQAGPIPENVELAHFNSVAGRDQWGPGPGRDGVALEIVVGRTLPRPGDVERTAEALTGKAVSARCSRYDRQDSAIQLADGTFIAAEADRHPDPIAEAVRWQICEGELIQVIGRARGVNRTAANPVDLLVLTDRPLPIPVDEAVSWDDLAPSAEDQMLGQGGVALVSPSDASRCYPNLWPTPAAAKMAAHRGQWVTFPIRKLSIGECYPLVLRQATYQRAGERQRPANLIFDPAAVPDLRDWLEERLGPLARLDIEDGPEPPEPDRPGGRPKPIPPTPVSVKPVPTSGVGEVPPTSLVLREPSAWLPGGLLAYTGSPIDAVSSPEPIVRDAGQEGPGLGLRRIPTRQFTPNAVFRVGTRVISVDEPAANVPPGEAGAGGSRRDSYPIDRQPPVPTNQPPSPIPKGGGGALGQPIPSMRPNHD